MSEKITAPIESNEAKTESGPPLNPKGPETVETRNPAAELDSARKHLAGKKADLKKYEGILGTLRTKLTGASEKKSAIQDETEAAEQKYRELRAEVIGDDVMKMLDEVGEKTKAMTEALAEKKGWGIKTLEAVRGAHKKLGEWNLEKLGWKPEGRIGKMVAKGLNARLAVNAGLVIGGTAFGGTLAAVGALTARRVMGGLGAGYGSYDFMRMRADKTDKKAVLEGLESASAEDLVERLERAEAQALVGGKDLTKDEGYLKLKTEFGKRFGGQAISDEGEPVKLTSEEVTELMSQKDAHVAELQKAYGYRSASMKLAATGIGLLAGSGLLAKGFMGAKHAIFGSAQPVEATVVLPNGDVAFDSHELNTLAPRVEDVNPADTLHPEVAEVVPDDGDAPSVEGTEAVAPEAPPAIDPETLKLAEIRKGDGVIKIVSRQLEAKREAWGYDAAKDGDIHEWAKNMSKELMKKNEISGDIRLRLDAANPGHVVVTPDGKIDLSDSKTYVQDATPVSEMEDPFEKLQKPSKVSDFKDPFVEDMPRKPHVPAPGDAELEKMMRGVLQEDAAVRAANAAKDAELERLMQKASKADVSHVEPRRPIYEPDPTRPVRVVDGNDPDIAKIREHARGAQLERASVMRSLNAFTNPKLTAVEHLEALKAACPADGKGIDLNGIDVANKGGKILAKIGNETIVVTPKNVDAVSKLASLMKEAQRSVADPEGYRADMDKVMKELGFVRPDAAK